MGKRAETTCQTRNQQPVWRVENMKMCEVAHYRSRKKTRPCEAGTSHWYGATESNTALFGASKYGDKLAVNQSLAVLTRI
jgi:hypothetical protein